MPKAKVKKENSDSKSETSTSRLYRSETNKVIAGVCGGLGDFFNVDPTIIRFIFVVITLLGGSGVLMYLVLWLVIPSANSGILIDKENIKKNAEEIKVEAKRIGENVKNYTENHNPRTIFGILLIILGGFWLMDTLGILRFFNFVRLWPLILVALGIAVLYRER